MLRRRLYLQIYFTIIASLVIVVLLSGLLWSVFGRDHFNHEVFDITGRLAYLSLPAALLPGGGRPQARRVLHAGHLAGVLTASVQNEARDVVQSRASRINPGRRLRFALGRATFSAGQVRMETPRRVAFPAEIYSPTH